MCRLPSVSTLQRLHPVHLPWGRGLACFGWERPHVHVLDQEGQEMGIRVLPCPSPETPVPPSQGWAVSLSWSRSSFWAQFAAVSVGFLTLGGVQQQVERAVLSWVGVGRS